MSRSHIIALLLLVALPVAIHSNALENGFHLDDFYRVVGNPGVESPPPVWRHFVDPGTSASVPRLQQYRPLLPLSLALDHARAGGHDLRTYHQVNLAWHVLSVLLVWRLILELLRDRVAPGRRDAVALAAALIYAVHPVSGVPVNYVCARDLLMMQAFQTGALLVYASLRRRGEGGLGGWGWGLTLLLAALSLLSKTNAVALPGAVLAYELCLGGGSLASVRTWRRVLPFALLVTAFFVWTTRVLGFSDVDQLDMGKPGLGPYIGFAVTQLDLHVSWYLRNAAWPFLMRPLPDLSPSTMADAGVWVGATVVAGSLWAAWRCRRSAPVVSFGILAYWVLFAPTASVVPLRRLAVDYRAYPSSPYLWLTLTLVFSGWWTPWARRGLLAAAIVFFGGASWLQNEIWRSEETLWGQSVRHGGEAIAHVNFARTLVGKDDLAARENLLAALEKQPGNVFALMNLGLLEIDTGRPQQGLARAEEAARMASDWADIQSWYAVALARTGRFDEAADAAVRAADLEPTLERHGDEALRRLYEAAYRAQDRGDWDTALRHLDALHARTGAYGDSHFLAGWALQQQDRLDGAIAEYESMLRSDRQHVQTHFNLAYAFMEQERHVMGREHFARVLELKPDYREAHLHLATCLEALGDDEGAAEQRALYDGGG